VIFENRNQILSSLFIIQQPQRVMHFLLLLSYLIFASGSALAMLAMENPAALGNVKKYALCDSLSHILQYAFRNSEAIAKC
jgi:hypothetical protein